MNLRAQARALFPTWSRRMRARWVWAKKLTYHKQQCKIGTLVQFDERHYKFAREMK